MAKIISLPIHFNRAEQDQLHWTILIRPNESDYVSISWSDSSQTWLLGIYTDSFDRLPALKEEALKKLKIAKATTKGGGSN